MLRAFSAEAFHTSPLSQNVTSSSIIISFFRVIFYLLLTLFDLLWCRPFRLFFAVPLIFIFDWFCHVVYVLRLKNPRSRSNFMQGKILYKSDIYGL